jgi:roadblock/LC7 domain-containing protein/putative sterol carrier protein
MTRVLDLDDVAAIPGVIAAGRFSADGTSSGHSAAVDGIAADLVSMMCAANTAMGRLQARGLALYTGDDRLSPHTAFLMVGGRFAALVADEVGVFLDIEQADLDAVLEVLVGPSDRRPAAPREPLGDLPWLVAASAVPGVEAACRFTDRGALLDFAGMTAARGAVLAQLCAANGAFARLQCDAFSAFSGQEWSPVLGWALRGAGASLMVTGNRALLVDNAACSFSATFAGLRDERGPLADDDEHAVPAAVPEPTSAPDPEFLTEPWMESYRRVWNGDAYLRRALRRFSATIQYAVADSDRSPVEVVVRSGEAVSAGRAGTGEPDFRLVASAGTWNRLATGDLRPRAAIRTGRLRMHGSLITATRHIDAFEESLRLLARVPGR